MTLSVKGCAEPTIYDKEYIMPRAAPKDFKPVSAEGTYSIEEMQFSASKAYYADGLRIEGNNFKVGCMQACPDMLLFACDKINALESELALLRGESPT
jgi:hypothetical protein